MKAGYVIFFALLVTSTACSGKKRPFADGPIEGLGGSGATSPTISAVEPVVDASSGTGVELMAAQGKPLGGAPVDTMSSAPDTVQSSGSLACESDAAACEVPDAGPNPAVCVPTGPRDCTSALDDCDDQPDDAVDEVCVCLPGTFETCDAHPGFDGRGPCRAGSRICVSSDDLSSSDWGACEGSRGPATADSCEILGDDSDCDGNPGEGCTCVNGTTLDCGPQSEVGSCERGTITCENGAFGQCQGEVFPALRDCRFAEDNDCDGRPDNTIDNVCECIPGQGNGPCSGNANSARCGATGRCEPCQVDADCAQVAANRNSCRGGACILPIVPAVLTGTATVTPPRAPLGGLNLVIYVDDSISGVVLTVTFTSFATNAAAIVSEINAVTRARVVASATADHIRLSTVEAGAGVFLSVYDTEASSILGLQGLGTTEGQTL